ncbi:hypothetical protein DES36_1063 [Alkalibaculum bacchi]|uniref:Uncharacterized protein n=1 Tax=Alkalibaculum bacchi TaxID=645887 RepID=A0A366IA32_9FIRM|nr:hypothetical protein [Alkalibaculum bacchi]RBP65894.1 hypothetical protein DES36_1063 [Alkalibaculum bacchi]
MWKLILVLIIIAFVDLKDFSIKEHKREFVIYIILHLIVLGLGLYDQSTKQISLMEFISNISKP